jgi:hypothetical protein
MKKLKSIKEVVGGKNPHLSKSWAEYSAKDFIPKYIVHRFDDKGDNRFYFFLYNGNVEIGSGITGPMGAVSTEREGINRWKDAHPNWRHLFNVSAEFGTLEHILAGGIFLGNGVNQFTLDSMKKIAIDNNQSGDMPIKDALAFLKFKEDYDIEPLIVEGQLAWQDPISGQWLTLTIDLLAKMRCQEAVKTMVQDGFWSRGEKKGEPKMVEQKTTVIKERILVGDIKSNFFEKEDKSYYETHIMQLIAGTRAVEQNFGIKVDGVFNLSPKAWVTTPSYTFKEHNITPSMNELFDIYWKLIVHKGLNVPTGNFITTEGFKNSSDFKLTSYREYAEQILLNPI